MADFKGQKRGKSHVQNKGIFFGGLGHGPESLCQISAYKFFSGKCYFYWTSVQLQHFICLVKSIVYGLLLILYRISKTK